MRGVITSPNVCKNPPKPIKHKGEANGDGKVERETDTRGLYLARAYQDNSLEPPVSSFQTSHCTLLIGGGAKHKEIVKSMLC